MTRREQLLVNIQGKRSATEEDMALYRRLDDGRVGIAVNSSVVPLLSLSGDDIPAADALREDTDLDRDAFSWDSARRTHLCGPPLPLVDHRPDQTPVKHQSDRGTCVAFASLAALEALLKRQGKATLLSEQYAHWLFKRFEGKDQCSDNLQTITAPDYLSRRGVCESWIWPYTSRYQTDCKQDPPGSVRARATVGIGNFALLTRKGLNGPGVRNLDYLECLLQRGHDVVLALYVAWGVRNEHGIHDVVLDPQTGTLLQAFGSHAMLLVGYDRNPTMPYFIFKNSWGPSDEWSGYRYYSYDYVQMYAKHGYVVLSVRTDMPTQED